MYLLTETAAMRRGCVTPTIPRRVKPASWRIRGICVVLPEPVGLSTTTTWWVSSAFRILSRCRYTGRLRASIESSLARPEAAWLHYKKKGG